MRYIKFIYVFKKTILQSSEEKMNIGYTEEPFKVVAKTCGCKEKVRKITYSFIDSYHNLCIDKRDIISAELEACERLLKYTEDNADRETIEKEVAELKMTLDLMP
jgi:hypothetical protein